MLRLAAPMVGANLLQMAVFLFIAWLFGVDVLPWNLPLVLLTMAYCAAMLAALGLVLVWLWRDALARGKNPWPWLLATLVVGSFAPLVYLWLREADQS